MIKKLAILSTIAISGLFYTNSVKAQVSIHLGINIPARPVYVPAPRPVVVEEAPVYDDDVSYDDDYYYLPEVEAYYSVPRHCYYYNDGNAWITAAYLPGAYRNYNWRTAVRYEVRASRPYLHHDIYRSRWGGYAGDRSNWGRRFESRSGYAYHSRDYRGWNRENYDRGNWNRRDNDGGNWNRRDNDHGNWNRGNNDRGNWNRGNDDRRNNGRGNWGNQRSDNRDHGNHGSERFAQNGFGIRH